MIGAEVTGWRAVGAWWHDRLDYRWLVRTLDARGALPVMKGIAALVGAVLAVILTMDLKSTSGPAGAWSLVTTFNIVFSVAWACYWWYAPWPSEKTSLILMASADVLTTAQCLVDSDRLFGALGLMRLVIPGGYLAIFHGPRILTVHSAWSVLSVLTLTWLTVHDAESDGLASVSIVLTMVSVTALVLPALQLCYWILRMDALTDPLTGLLNRRGLDYYVSSWFQPGIHDSIALMTIDLDRFKQVNDTFGHRVGDEVLVRTAACLLAARPPASIVTRSGGEEFVVLAPLDAGAAMSEAERLCQAVAAAIGPVTASIGVAVTADDTRPDPEQLLRRSDSAMYRAKQLGGNTVVFAA
ncbi:GGDEF domain-containing protein [Nocardia stercoris]|uniref:GGDEF domain-containing protein n=1 Tax=Nocardia stercoris TaxID=2483361 RepID=A0A3M2L0Z1_9NOCA|nr:GGDEF domain-containing protein [Nocardia stercoris]RMI30400.1 GGDEF domain-containing protein [Nocardia stercoris]